MRLWICYGRSRCNWRNSSFPSNLLTAPSPISATLFSFSSKMLAPEITFFFLSFSSSHFYNSYFLFLILLNPLWSAIPCLEFDIHWMFVIAEDHDCKNCIYFHLPFLLFWFWIYIYLCLCAKLKWYHGRESLRNEKFIVHCSDWTFSWLIHDWTFLLWYFKL